MNMNIVEIKNWLQERMYGTLCVVCFEFKLNYVFIEPTIRHPNNDSKLLADRLIVILDR